MPASEIPVPPASRAPLKGFRLSPATVLVLLAVVLGFARLRTFDEPMDRDLGDYATIAHELRFGKRLYTDIPEQKPPAIHLTYYAGESIAGYGHGQIYLINVAGSILTLLGVYWVCSSALGSTGAGLWAAAFWTVISGCPQLEGNQPNSELFMNAFLTLGFACIARAYSRQTGWRNALIAGALFAWATLYKQVVVTVPMMLGLAYFLCPPKGKKRLHVFGEVALIGLVIAAGWGLTAGYFWSQGRLHDFITWIVDYNRGYAGSLSGNFVRSLGRLFPHWMYPTIPLVLLGLLGAGLGLSRKSWQPSLFLSCLAIAVYVAVTLPGKFFPHYYQLWLPCLVVGAGFCAAELQRAFPRHCASALVPVFVLVVLIITQAPMYFQPAAQWSRLKYGEIFVTADKLSSIINGLLEPNETFFQMGDETQLYPETGRRPPLEILGTSGLCVPGPFTKPLRHQMIAGLAESKPDLLVFHIEGGALAWDHEVADFVDRNYRLAPHGRVNAYFLWVRKGSALEARMEKMAAAEATGSSVRR